LDAAIGDNDPGALPGDEVIDEAFQRRETQVITDKLRPRIAASSTHTSISASE
jgi:hypothetical protein